MSHDSCHTYEWFMSHVTSVKKTQNETTRVKKSCHTYEWVMSHDSWVTTHESCVKKTRKNETSRVQTSCHTYGWVMSHVIHTKETQQNDAWYMDESCHRYESWHTYEWATSRVTSHVWMSHESCHTYEGDTTEWCLAYRWVMSHIWVSYESYHTYEWVMTHVIYMKETRNKDILHMRESCHTYTNTLCHTCERVMTHIYQRVTVHTITDVYVSCELIFIGHCPQKSPIISGSFGEMPHSCVSRYTSHIL